MGILESQKIRPYFQIFPFFHVPIFSFSHVKLWENGKMGKWGQIFPFSHILIGNWENWKYQLMSQTHISSSNLLNHASQLRSQLKPQIYGSDLRHNLRSQSHISDLSRIFPFSNFPVENWENWTIRPDFPNFQFSHVKFSNGMG